MNNVSLLRFFSHWKVFRELTLTKILETGALKCIVLADLQVKLFLEHSGQLESVGTV
tara:strand:- start:3 stop:173 length:171 start_codon:yes stop_codon:yes gene_type:complete